MDFLETSIKEFFIHKVGNKNNAEALVISKESQQLGQNDFEELIHTYWLNAFGESGAFHFYHNEDLKFNEAYNFIKDLFLKNISLKEASASLARRLYDVSEHPKIIGGELYVIKLEDINIEGNFYDGLALFKTESKEPFLKTKVQEENFELSSHEGTPVAKVDKACIIANLNEENGFLVKALDKTNKSSDARYWIDHFLGLKTANDSWNNTEQAMNLTKKFLTEALDQRFEVEKPFKVELLNRSSEYFKENETFVKKDFQEQVLREEDLIGAYSEYEKDYERDFDWELKDEFEISKPAFKKKNRIFKSVLKLDKNFHVYIHGDRNKIESGFDEEKNMKYYKIYYDKEQ